MPHILLLGAGFGYATALKTIGRLASSRRSKEWQPWKGILVGSLFLISGCMSTNPDKWHPIDANTDRSSLEEIISKCRDLAWDESRPARVYVDPITGSVMRKNAYEKCMKESGWRKIESSS